MIMPPILVPPKINTVGRLHRVQVGETLILPCDVSDLGPMILMWKKGHRVLTAGKMTVRRDRRITLEGSKNSNLQITGLKNMQT